ncbi:MAG TPA: hypothetical protein VNN10_07180 [Dehalococcoidia bacterium]|nr:hypothetical protein [Dehalococcoidia bacterium]
MSQKAQPLRWAPRVPQALVRRLYESEAAGRLDEELLDEVGIALYARCDSILKATEAHRGRLECPACRAEIIDGRRDRFRRKEAPLSCGACGWATTWQAVLRTLQGKELVGGAAESYFRRYVEGYPRARFGRDKMLIDALLHEFHSSARFGDVRPAAVNVIEGRLRSVMAFLDELAGLNATPGQRSWQLRAPESVFGRLALRRGEPGG